MYCNVSRFVPIQRWLHTLEHGGVVLLYHPCTHHALVEELKFVPRNCLRKHVMTPYDQHTLERVRDVKC